MDNLLEDGMRDSWALIYLSFSLFLVIKRSKSRGEVAAKENEKGSNISVAVALLWLRVLRQ